MPIHEFRNEWRSSSGNAARAGRNRSGIPEKLRALESLRLARTELERQLAVTLHERRKTQIHQALEELDRRMKEAEAT